MSLRRLGTAVGVVTLAASGTYVFVYLARWEWNRATIAGLLFVATEVALVAMVVLGRLATLEHRMTPSPDERALTRVRETAPPAKPRFEWMEGDGLNVFVPLLMGAGLIVSVVAMAVERIAQRTARPALEERLAGRLAPLMLAPAGVSPTGLPVENRRLRPIVQGLLVLSLAAIVAGGIDVLGDLTQTRPDSSIPETQTTLLVNVEANAHPYEPTAVARRLWEACRGTVRSTLVPPGLRVEAGHIVRLTLTPALGQHQERRLRGCIEDVTLDNVRADLLRMEHLTPGG